MAPPSTITLRVRRSINAIWQDYQKGKKEELTNLIRAWKGVQDISRKDPNAWNSYFKIGGLHGEPFRGAGYANAAWWGGYCHHGNVLFPTWHRAYCLRLEDALRSIPKCQNVTLPFWDETGEDTEKNGIPGIFFQQKFELDGQEIDNPLYSYTFPQNIVDRVNQDKTAPTYNQYTKGKGYQTVRYPYAGLVGTPDAVAATQTHNKQFTPEQAAAYLNTNVIGWLGASITVGGQTINTGVRQKYQKCLFAPNYTVFSNTTSAQAWNDDASPDNQVVPLESPHNSIHLAVGGFGAIEGASGDMGENDTAGLDPIFHFHHAEVDRYFWLWQQQNDSTDRLVLIDEYPGTNSVDHQGPTPGLAGGTWLTLETELLPFKLTSNDVINIEKLGYTYETEVPDTPEPQMPESSVVISGVNKSSIAGSHLLQAYAEIDGKKQLVSQEAVLSRWHVTGCANCQLQDNMSWHLPLHGISTDDINSNKVKVTTEVQTRKLGTLTPTFEVIGKKETFLTKRLGGVKL